MAVSMRFISIAPSPYIHYTAYQIAVEKESRRGMEAYASDLGNRTFIVRLQPSLRTLQEQATAVVWVGVSEGHQDTVINFGNEGLPECVERIRRVHCLYLYDLFRAESETD